MEESGKRAWLSKTLWINLILAVAPFVPVVDVWLKAHPEALIQGFAIFNMALRLISKDKIVLS